MTESAGNPQDLLSDPSTTFVDDDGSADEPIDEFVRRRTAPAPRRAKDLPPGFRMRHESHYVDDLSAAPTIRQVAISEIDRDVDARRIDAVAREPDRLDSPRRHPAAAARGAAGSDDFN